MTNEKRLLRASIHLLEGDKKIDAHRRLSEIDAVLLKRGREHYFCKMTFDTLAIERLKVKKMLVEGPNQLLEKKMVRLENEMSRMCMAIAENYIRKGDFRKYPEQDQMEMVQQATIRCWSKLDLYKPEKKHSPLAYFTSAVYSTFCNYLRVYYRNKNREIPFEKIDNVGEVM